MLSRSNNKQCWAQYMIQSGSHLWVIVIHLHAGCVVAVSPRFRGTCGSTSYEHLPHPHFSSIYQPSWSVKGQNWNVLCKVHGSYRLQSPITWMISWGKMIPDCLGERRLACMGDRSMRKCLSNLMVTKKKMLAKDYPLHPLAANIRYNWPMGGINTIALTMCRGTICMSTMSAARSKMTHILTSKNVDMIDHILNRLQKTCTRAPFRSNIGKKSKILCCWLPPATYSTEHIDHELKESWHIPHALILSPSSLFVDGFLNDPLQKHILFSSYKPPFF